MLNGGTGPSISLARVKPQSSTHSLYLTLGPGDYFSFINESGRPAHVLQPGDHRLIIWNRSAAQTIRLHGPGVRLSTATQSEIEYRQLTLKAHARYVLKTTSPARMVTLKTSAR